jgi:hypothetical protein
MFRQASLHGILFSVTACLFLTGCPQAPQEEGKTTSPGSDAGLRRERTFRKKLNAPNTPSQDAVFAYLDEDKERFRAATAELTPDSQPPAFTKSLKQYLEQSDNVDLSALPPSFKTAVQAYLKSYRELTTAIAPMPNGAFPGVEFQSGLRALFHGDRTKGKTLGGGITTAIQEIRDSTDKLFEAAAVYGVDADR